MKKLWFRLAFLLIAIPNWALAVNYNPKFEFGTISADKCSISGPAVTCDIKFEHSYSAPPLVFVMSTINASRSNFATKTTEYPSALRVWSVSNLKAVIKQRIAPHAKSCKWLKYKKNSKGEWVWQCVNNSTGSKVNYVDAPMENIDYLVIEPGVLEFNNGAKIVAGSFATKKTISGKSGGGSGTSVSFSSYGLNSNFSSAPGVLVQLQSRENGSSDQPTWLTATAKEPSENNVTVMLERSEVTGNSNLAKFERVGFVAGLGKGFVNGRKFWLGQGSTKNTLQLDDKVIKPVTEGCKQVVNFSESDFNKIPTLIASKSARKGPNGGWLRRCSVTRTGVSLIVEEDMHKDAERSHTLEPFSYFLFDKPPSSGVCSLFPSPAQTWVSNNQAAIIIENNANISGAPISGGKRYIGFAKSDVTDRKNKGCDGSECFGDTGLRVTKQQLESFQTPDTGLGTVTVQSNQTRTFQESESIGTLTINNNATAIFKTGKYWVDSINVLGDIKIPDGEIVEIHTKGFALSNGSHFKTVDSGELVVYVHNLSYNGSVIHSWVDLANNSKFVGLLYSEKNVILSNNAIIEGAVTAKTVTLNNGSKIIATNKCFDPADDYKVTMTPETDIALMCDDVPVFTINTTNNDETESLPVTVEVDPNANRFNVTAEPGFGSGSYPNFTSNSSGVLKLKVTPKNTSNISLSTNYNLSVTMDDDTSQSVKSQFKFVPFKFEVPDQTVIAGKDNDVTTTVLACSDTGKTKVETYSGTPSISYEVKKPDPTLAKKGVLTYAPVFTSGDKGAREDTLKISESGEFLVTLTDDKFDCTGLSGCPIDGGGKLTGSFTIKSRPWKIAICDVKAPLAGGTTKDNPGATTALDGAFISAGELFKASLKPVVYSDSSGVDECTLAATFNYFTDTKGHSAPYVASLEVAYPSGGKLANLAAPLIGEFASTDKNSTNDRMKTLELRWNEVGTLKMKSNAHYQSTSLVEDEESIGRFYPDYFNITQSTWTAPDQQGGSTYMGQPFQSVAFEIKAYNSTGDETKNYGSFDEVLKASFYLRGDKSDRVSILDSELDASHWGNKTGIWSRSWTDAKWNRIGAGAKITTPDGPYNSTWVGDVKTTTELSLSLDSSGDGNSNHTDPTLFKVTGTDGTISKAASQLLAAQPDVRYGRMRLQDVGGNQGYSVRVPLSIEYWRAGSFVLNAKDSNSRFDTSNNMQCNHIEWSEITPAVSDAKLANTLNPVSDDGSVDRGESLSIYARQSTSRREQVRLFLRQGSTANPDGATCSWSTGIQPWLIYNWRNKGDEDPSAVVTFGINRGNDRIIFRNEPGLTN